MLQDLLPNARVFYSSATGASEPRNLCYMTRIPVKGFNSMSEVVQTLDGCVHLISTYQPDKSVFHYPSYF